MCVCVCVCVCGTIIRTDLSGMLTGCGCVRVTPDGSHSDGGRAASANGVEGSNGADPHS